jgi:hypothetical protein
MILNFHSEYRRVMSFSSRLLLGGKDRQLRELQYLLALEKKSSLESNQGRAAP